ncbi:MAG: hypothetical protein OXF06_08385, partial [Bacteroidetes bacterium]|nr:hypothetical protein [Bacteroidota bacterium]
MLSVGLIREHPELIQESLIKRGTSEKVQMIDEILREDKRRREALTLQQTKQQDLNSESRSISTLM